MDSFFPWRIARRHAKTCVTSRVRSLSHNVTAVTHTSLHCQSHLSHFLPFMLPCGYHVFMFGWLIPCLCHIILHLGSVTSPFCHVPRFVLFLTRLYCVFFLVFFIPSFVMLTCFELFIQCMCTINLYLRLFIHLFWHVYMFGLFILCLYHAVYFRVIYTPFCRVYIFGFLYSACIALSFGVIYTPFCHVHMFGLFIPFLYHAFYLGLFIPLYISRCSMMLSVGQSINWGLCHSCVWHRCVNKCDHTPLTLLRFLYFCLWCLVSVVSFSIILSW